MVKNIIFAILVVFLIIVSIKGLPGNPTPSELNSRTWIEEGPFPLSPERGRYALLYSLAENRSFYFTVDLARFAIPDLGYINGRYVSLFAPAVSYLAIPGYFLGKFFGIAQVGAFAVISFFSMFNFYLIRSITGKLVGNNVIGSISAIIYSFATPAFAYAGVLYQHHVSAFLILLSIYLLINFNNKLSLFVILMLCAASIPIDYPNLIYMFPIGLAALGQIFHNKINKYYISISFKPAYLISLFGVIPPLLFFIWFNQKSYGNPFQFSGTVATVKDIDNYGKPTVPDNFKQISNPERYLRPELQQKSATKFFKTRNFINGIYIQTISPDRGMLFFAPILFLSLFGFYVLIKDKNIYLPLFMSITALGFVLYSMWGDPWGGWAFGSRYLIPAYAILSIVAGYAVSHFYKKWLFVTIFAILFSYSSGVNLSGALTSIANPPQVEAGALESISGRVEKYSWDRNWENLKTGEVSSYLYNQFFKNLITPIDFYWLLFLIISSMGIVPLIWLRLKYR